MQILFRSCGEPLPLVGMRAAIDNRGMDSKDLTRDQVTELKAKAAEMNQWLRKLELRMTETGFPEDDALLQSTKRAHLHMHDLWIHLHYLECDRGRQER